MSRFWLHSQTQSLYRPPGTVNCSTPADALCVRRSIHSMQMSTAMLYNFAASAAVAAASSGFPIVVSNFA